MGSVRCFKAVPSNDGSNQICEKQNGKTIACHNPENLWTPPHKIKDDKKLSWFDKPPKKFRLITNGVVVDKKDIESPSKSTSSGKSDSANKKPKAKEILKKLKEKNKKFVGIPKDKKQIKQSSVVQKIDIFLPFDRIEDSIRAGKLLTANQVKQIREKDWQKYKALLFEFEYLDKNPDPDRKKALIQLKKEFNETKKNIIGSKIVQKALNSHLMLEAVALVNTSIDYSKKVGNTLVDTVTKIKAIRKNIKSPTQLPIALAGLMRGELNRMNQKDLEKAYIISGESPKNAKKYSSDTQKHNLSWKYYTLKEKEKGKKYFKWQKYRDHSF